MSSHTTVQFAALLLLLVGCGPKAQPSSAVNSPFTAVPQLPSPRAGSYARVIQTPKDPGVIAVLAERRWDASLAGAAAGLALRSLDGTGGFSRREIREAAWQAGYPYPIAHLAVWQTQPKDAPPPDVQTWLTDLSDVMDVGLVRARNGKKDLWVALAAHPLIDLGVIPREIAMQAPLLLPAVPRAQLEVSGPLGQWQEYDLETPLTIHLDSEGEWLFAITDDTGDLARFTLYAGTEAPSAAIIEGNAIPVSNAEAATLATFDILADARELYGLLPWSKDPFLESSAATLLDSALDGERKDKMAVWECEGRTVEDCVDQMLWIPAYRTTLLNPDAKYVGIAATVDDGGVSLRVLIAAE